VKKQGHENVDDKRLPFAKEEDMLLYMSFFFLAWSSFMSLNHSLLFLLANKDTQT
jgi:hypothetical protein